LLEKSAAGSIVVVGSTAMAEVYGPTRSYAAVKATLVPYVKGLARNLAAKNLRANMVSPGNVFFEGGVWDIVRQRNPQMFAEMLGRNPTGRMGTPEEVANAVVFLASPSRSSLTKSPAFKVMWAVRAGAAGSYSSHGPADSVPGSAKRKTTAPIAAHAELRQPRMIPSRSATMATVYENLALPRQRRAFSEGRRRNRRCPGSCRPV